MGKRVGEASRRFDGECLDSQGPQTMKVVIGQYYSAEIDVRNEGRETIHPRPSKFMLG